MRSPLRCVIACFGVACFVSVGSARADFTLVDDGFELTTHPSGFRTVATSPGVPFYMGRSPDGSNTASLATDNTAGFTGTVLSINGSTAAATKFSGDRASADHRASDDGWGYADSVVQFSVYE